MIKANHKNFVVRFSIFYTKRVLRKYFRSIRYIGEFKSNKLPVVVISNHFSYWDGFIHIMLNQKLWKKRFHFMMLEEELQKNMILSKIGAFSVNKSNFSSIDSIRYSAEILRNPDNLLLFFPQGEIQSLYTNRFSFEKGVLSHILKQLDNKFQMVFSINLIDYSSFKKPEISAYFKTYSVQNNTTPADIESDFNGYMLECLKKQKGT